MCHRIAQELGGGGHPNASGADLGLRGLAYWWYVVRRGQVEAVERLAQSALRHLGQPMEPAAQPAAKPAARTGRGRGKDAAGP